MKEANRFFEALFQGKDGKKYFFDFHEIHLHLFPQYKNNPEQATHLWKIIQYLSDTGKIKLPVKRKYSNAWRAGNPQLPDWIQKKATKKTTSFFIPNNYAWHPKLASFVDDLILSQKKTAFKISEYLKQHPSKGAFKLSIPRRERSLKIFGDEKRLDSLSQKGILLSGHLKLEDLGCHNVSWPMLCHFPSIPCPNKPFLIIENHHTYESFRRWNEKAHQYTGIGYGGGEAFSSLETADYLDMMINLKEVNEIQYFGDIDPKGIRIPARVSDARVARKMTPIRPATKLYHWLLDHGIQRCYSKKSAISYPKGWLTEHCETKVDALFSQQKWLPQEALGYEELMSDKNLFMRNLS